MGDKVSLGAAPVLLICRLHVEPAPATGRPEDHFLWEARSNFVGCKYSPHPRPTGRPETEPSRDCPAESGWSETIGGYPRVYFGRVCKQRSYFGKSDKECVSH